VLKGAVGVSGLVEGVEGGHVLGGEREVEDASVLDDPLVREVEAGDGGDLQAADLDPAVAAVAGVVLAGMSPQGRGRSCWCRVGWLAFTRSR
jgi:hypothetical protein